MKNPLLIMTETYMGTGFVCLIAIFFGSLLMIAIKNFETDIDIMTATSVNNRIVHLTETERLLLLEWVDRNNIDVPSGRGYRHIIKQYPDRPWLD